MNETNAARIVTPYVNRQVVPFDSVHHYICYVDFKIIMTKC